MDNVAEERGAKDEAAAFDHQTPGYHRSHGKRRCFATKPGLGRMHNLCSALTMNKKELDEAAKMLREALGVFENRLGPGHSTTTLTRGVLARTLKRQGNTREALALLWILSSTRHSDSVVFLARSLQHAH
ncbi:hypothetical protein LZ30DRAFT_724182 [Colletotrichum cereale]|nr:hypothetical protein LZ30DRAFT_724182 [Colletotrichum cereale]